MKTETYLSLWGARVIGRALAEMPSVEKLFEPLMPSRSRWAVDTSIEATADRSAAVLNQ